MKIEPDPGVVALFGSRTRVLTLAPIANSRTPLTAYRIARTAGLQRIKVYSELRRLSKVGIVCELRDDRGCSVWEICDPDLRRILIHRVRLTDVSVLRADRARLARSTKQFMAAYRRNPIEPERLEDRSAVRNKRDFARSPQKDAILVRLGLKPANRAPP